MLMMNRRAELPIPPDRLERPKLAPNVRLHEPLDGGSWFLQRGTSQYFAIAPDFARLVSVLDGVRDQRELAELLGPPWRVSDVASVVNKLARFGMLDDGKQKARRDSWFRFVPPLTLQLKLVNPARPLARLAPLVRLLANRWGALVGIAAVLLGLVAMVLQAGAVSAALSRPLPYGAYLWILAGVLATTAVHEVGHGAVLTYYGGRPSRMGVMLFYLSPAFFCDVSDGWRLPRKEQRVHVALAGIGVQVIIASLAAASTLGQPPSTTRDALLVFAVISYVAGLFNLIPFVKLDGYIALMCSVNVPHLRNRAMVDARRFLARGLFGGRYARELPALRWAVPFGLVCLAFPVYLILNAMFLWVDLIQRLGLAGAVLMSSALCYFAYHLIRGFGRLVTEARRAGARWWRIVVASLLTAGAATALLLYTKVPLTVAGGYVVRDGGSVELVLPTTTDRDLITDGAEVRLYRAGLVTKVELGTARVGDPTGVETSAPLSAFAPIETDVVQLPAVGYPLHGASVPARPVGAATVDAGSVPLGSWLWTRYIAPAFHW